jgi:hypothetical protein
MSVRPNFEFCSAIAPPQLGVTGAGLYELRTLKMGRAIRARTQATDLDDAVTGMRLAIDGNDSLLSTREKRLRHGTFCPAIH